MVKLTSALETSRTMPFEDFPITPYLLTGYKFAFFRGIGKRIIWGKFAYTLVDTHFFELVKNE